MNVEITKEFFKRIGAMRITEVKQYLKITKIGQTCGEWGEELNPNYIEFTMSITEEPSSQEANLCRYYTELCEDVEAMNTDNKPLYNHIKPWFYIDGGMEYFTARIAKNKDVLVEEFLGDGFDELEECEETLPPETESEFAIQGEYRAYKQYAEDIVGFIQEKFECGENIVIYSVGGQLLLKTNVTINEGTLWEEEQKHFGRIKLMYEYTAGASRKAKMSTYKTVNNGLSSQGLERLYLLAKVEMLERVIDDYKVVSFEKDGFKRVLKLSPEENGTVSKIVEWDYSCSPIIVK